PGDSNLLESFIDRSETARHLGTIGVGKLVRQRHQILFFSQNIGRHAPVPLPAVGGSKLARTAYHVATAAVVAHAAPGNMINYNAISLFEPLEAGTLLHNLSARFVPCNFVLVSFRPFPDVLAVDRPDIAPANRGRLRFDQDLTMPGLGNGKLFKFYG